MINTKTHQINDRDQYQKHSLLLTAGRNGTGRAASWLHFAALSSGVTQLAALQQLPVMQIVERQLRLLRRAAPAPANPAMGRPISCYRLLQHAY